jgi:hypothetical protein
MSFVNQAIVAAWLKTNQTITLSQRERLLGLLNREYFFKN